MQTRPTFNRDPYGRSMLANPYPGYQAIRDLGAAVWIPKREMWAIGRFDDVRAALRADSILVSGKGVAANPAANGLISPITLTSDGDIHRRRREVLMRPVMPPALKDLRGRLEAEAEALVERLLTAGEFDAMQHFASHLPVTVVAELVGLNEVGRRNMLRWAAASFDFLGAMNGRGLKAMPRMMELGGYVQSLTRDVVAPEGWAARLFEAAEKGELSPDEARTMVIDYVGPSLDTTILATGQMLWRLAVTPGAYDAVRADPSLIPGVVNETVRLDSPLRSFTRFAEEDYEAGEVFIPKGERVMMLYASANRDERHYAEPDVFDVRRNPRDQIGWGHGQHTCVGMHLARLEMELLLGALVRKVGAIRVGEPTRAWNNVLQGFRTLPASFTPAA